MGNGRWRIDSSTSNGKEEELREQLPTSKLPSTNHSLSSTQNVHPFWPNASEARRNGSWEMVHENMVHAAWPMAHHPSPIARSPICITVMGRPANDVLSLIIHPHFSYIVVDPGVHR